MTAPLSITTGFAMAVQSTKGTGATTGFIRGRMRQSAVDERFEYAEAQNEHTGIHERPTDRQSASQRSGTIVDISGRWALYPDLIGVALRAIGFSVSTVDNTGYYTHTFTLADRDAIGWVTVMQALGEGSARFERKVTDCRLSELTLTAGRNGIEASMTGLGLSLATSAGTETVSAETNAKLSQSNGSFSIGGSILGTPRANEFRIALDLEEDQPLHSFTATDLPALDLSIGGTLRDVDMDLATYKEMFWGGSSGTGAVVAIPNQTLSFSWQSPGNISGQSVPYSLSISFTGVEIRAGNFEAVDNNLVRFDAEYLMTDTSASAPITITLVNTVSSYS